MQGGTLNGTGVSTHGTVKNDAAGVGRGQGVGNLRGDVERGHEIHRLFAHMLPQRFAFNEFSRNTVSCLNLIDLKNGDDVGMIQGGGSLGFLYEAPHSIVIRYKFSRQDL